MGAESGQETGFEARAGCRATRAAAGSGALLVLVTCTGDGLDHRVSDSALGDARRSGRYGALCGRLVVPAPLVAPAGPACPICAEVLTRSERPPSSGVLTRLIRWLGGGSSGLRPRGDHLSGRSRPERGGRWGVTAGSGGDHPGNPALPCPETDAITREERTGRSIHCQRSVRGDRPVTGSSGPAARASTRTESWRSWDR